jgi:hypothetical protein
MHPERNGNHKEVLTLRDGAVLQRKRHVGRRRHDLALNLTEREWVEQRQGQGGVEEEGDEVGGGGLPISKGGGSGRSLLLVDAV